MAPLPSTNEVITESKQAQSFEKGCSEGALSYGVRKLIFISSLVLAGCLHG
jgi:hypothetical protein